MRNQRLAHALVFFAITNSVIQLHADVFFVDSFDGPSLVPELFDIANGYSLSGGSANATGRNYIRTVSGGYLATDFIAELTYTQGTGGGAAGVFFGLGPANKNANFFNEPYPSVFLVDHAADFTFPGVNIRRWSTNGSSLNSGDIFYSDGSQDFSGLALVRLTKVGDSLTFAADLQYNGSAFSPVLSQTISLSSDAAFLHGANTHVFFGTDTSPTSFHKFELRSIPEPHGFVLLGFTLGGSLALKRFRRFRMPQ